MRWVKLTFACPVRSRYELIALRLTSSSFAGTFLKLVAVGTERLFSMFSTIRAATPRIGVPTSGASPLLAGVVVCETLAGCGVAGAAGGGVTASADGDGVEVGVGVSTAVWPFGR